MLKQTICQAKDITPSRKCAYFLKRPITTFGFIASWVLLAVVYVYRYIISPLIPARCRFYPSCSEYATLLLRNHRQPFYRSIWLILKRLVRCHPGSPGGVDFPPQCKSNILVEPGKQQ